MRPKFRDQPQSSPQEQAEYGACLSQLGAIDEARGLLSQTSSTQAPDALLFSAFCHFAQWDYASAIPLLQSYVALREPGSYPMRIGQLNLASALTNERRFEEAAVLCEELIQAASATGSSLLLGNACEILAQCQMEQGHWALAASSLDRSRAALQDTGTFDSIYVSKWSAILMLRSTGATRGSLDAIARVRASASKRGNWETVRDCDLQLGIHARSTELLRKVYFGTPYESYRRKILQTAVRHSIDPDVVSRPPFDWRLGPGRAPLHTLDLATGRCACGKGHLKAGQVLHRLLGALARDHYKPQSIPELFCWIHPGEHYHPISSPMRAHQALLRLRQWIQRTRHPLRVGVRAIQSQERYRLDAIRGGVILRSSPEANATCLPPLLAALSETGTAPFSTDWAAAIWGTSPRNAARRLRTLQASGHLLREGSTKGCRWKPARHDT